MIIMLSMISILAFPSTWLFSLSSLCLNIPFFIWKDSLILQGLPQKLPAVEGAVQGGGVGRP